MTTPIATPLAAITGAEYADQQLFVKSLLGFFLGVRQVNDFHTSGRTFGTVFQNTTGHPIFVSVASTAVATATIGPSNVPAIPVVSAGFLVPAGWFYEVVSAGAVSVWTEWI